MTGEWPRRGDLWLATVPGETRHRPCAILSANWLNEYALDVSVVPITSVARSNFPTRVHIPAGEGGLRVDSWAKCDQVTTIRRSSLSGSALGRLPSERMHRIADAVRLALDL
jgi:mRNA interferase MazF